jgi:CheY-like chemotaxis protein
VRKIQDLLDECIGVSRSLAVDLYPPILHQAGLIAGLDWLAGWMKEKYGLIVELRSAGKLEPEREDVKVLLFQSVRELLLNVVKHAQVTRAGIEVSRSEAGQLSITVSDQGRGFDASKLGKGLPGVTAGFGLDSIRERLAFLGGCLEVESSPGGGTRCRMIAPLAKPRTGMESRDPRPRIRLREHGASSRRLKGEQKIRLLLADDHVVMREGLSRLLNEYPEIQVVGEASDGLHALRLARELQPDVVLMDLNMPGLNGIDATRILHAEMPRIRVIGLSMYEEEERARAMYEAGAAAYLKKTGDPAGLLAAIHACLE